MSSAMWKSELASVCRRHRDLVAIYEAPEGTLALLLRQTLVPLSEERGRWFNDTRRTARAVVASLRAAGVTEDVTVLQWRPLPDVAQVLTGWPCCYLSDPRRCAQLADIVGARLADGEPAAPAPLGRGENGLRAAALAIPPTIFDWYRDMAPCFLAVEPPVRRRLILRTHHWIVERVLMPIAQGERPVAAALGAGAGAGAPARGAGGGGGGEAPPAAPGFVGAPPAHAPRHRGGRRAPDAGGEGAAGAKRAGGAAGTRARGGRGGRQRQP